MGEPSRFTGLHGVIGDLVEFIAFWVTLGLIIWWVMS